MLFSLFLAANDASALGRDVYWYYGNSGLSPNGLGSAGTDFENAVKGEGASRVTYSSSWPSSFTSYKLVVLSIHETTFSSAYTSDLQDFLDDGGIILMVGESSSISTTYHTYMNGLLDDLGVSSDFKTGQWSSSCGSSASRSVTNDLTNGATTLEIGWSGSITVSGAGEELYVGDDGQVVAAADGGVVMLADANALTDACDVPSANMTFVKNIYNYDGSSACAEPDADGDGYDAELCGGDDCDDEDASINPGEYRYEDGDGDGYGNADERQDACSAPSDWVENGNDCDDSDRTVKEDEGPFWEDGDEDGFGDPAARSDDCDGGNGLVTNDEDCDDHDDGIYPDAEEICDEEDNDCDGDTDEEAVDATVYYYDGDGDGYGDPEDSKSSCGKLDDYVKDGGDCADGDPNIYPGTEDYEETCADEVNPDGTSKDKGGSDEDDAECACPLSAGGALMAPLALLIRGRRRRH